MRQSAANLELIRLFASGTCRAFPKSVSCYLSVAVLRSPRNINRMASSGINFTSSSQLLKNGIEITNSNLVASLPSIRTIHRQHGRLLQNRRPINRLTLCASPALPLSPLRPSLHSQQNPRPTSFAHEMQPDDKLTHNPLALHCDINDNVRRRLRIHGRQEGGEAAGSAYACEE